MAQPNWDESRHPRWPAGSSQGGEFARAGVAGGLAHKDPDWPHGPNWKEGPDPLTLGSFATDKEIAANLLAHTNTTGKEAMYLVKEGIVEKYYKGDQYGISWGLDGENFVKAATGLALWHNHPDKGDPNLAAPSATDVECLRANDGIQQMISVDFEGAVHSVTRGDNFSNAQMLAGINNMLDDRTPDNSDKNHEEAIKKHFVKPGLLNYKKWVP